VHGPQQVHPGHAEQCPADGHSGEERDRPGQGPALAEGVEGQLGDHRLGERCQPPEEPEESPAQDRPAEGPHVLK
jgi:hypothetical protein